MLKLEHHNSISTLKDDVKTLFLSLLKHRKRNDDGKVKDFIHIQQILNKNGFHLVLNMTCRYVLTVESVGTVVGLNSSQRLGSIGTHTRPAEQVKSS